MEEQRKIFLVTSCKGCVGKSTVAVNLAMAMAICGRRVLIADCDTTNRTVDLLLGYEDAGMFDLRDVSEGRVAPSDAVLRDPRTENLFYCSLPHTGTQPSVEKIATALTLCADTVSAEYLIIDTSGGIDFPRALYEYMAYGAIIVSTHTTASLRAAERTGSELARAGVRDIRLIINCFDIKTAMYDEGRAILDIIDSTHVPLLGVVLYDEELRIAQEKGMPAACVEKSASPEAFYNIARRIFGESVPLFDGMEIKHRRRLVSPADGEDAEYT